MTGTPGLRRLPVAVRPVPGESLCSVLEQTARAHGVPVHTVLAAAGIDPWTPNGRALGRLGEDPSGHEQALAHVLGLSTDRLTAMTLRGVPDPSIEWDRGRAVHLGWGTTTHGRHCPRCLAENGGRWLLAWLTPWTLVCRRHDTVLSASCGTCGQAPRSRLTALAVALPAGTRCTATVTVPFRRGTSALCRADLTARTTSTPAGSHALLGQAFVDGLRQAHDDDPVAPDGEPAPVRDHLQDLRLLARHMHRVVVPGDYDLMPDEARTWHEWTAHRDRPSTAAPFMGQAGRPSRHSRHAAEAAACAIAIGLAAAVVGAPDLQAATRLLEPAIRSAQATTRGVQWRYAVRQGWLADDAAQWLLDALGYSSRT